MPPRKRVLITEQYRNALERSVGDELAEAGVRFKYEAHKVPYLVPARKATYLPDFEVDDTSIIIETKGWFGKGAKERQKLILLKEQHPERDIRIVFQNAKKKIYKNSPTTYGKWATDHGFKWADKGHVPLAWVEEIRETQSGRRRATR